MRSREKLNSKAFTLIELIIFIVVAGIFIPFSYIAFSSILKEALTPEIVTKARFIAEQKIEEITRRPFVEIPVENTEYQDVPGHSGYKWKWRIENVAYKGTGPIVSEPDPWQRNAYYALGQYVRPTNPNGYFYRCIRSGRSGNSEPLWCTGLGCEVLDGGVKWKESTAYKKIVVYVKDPKGNEYTFSTLVTRRPLDET